MPTIICSYCEYVGQGDEYEDRITDVEAHEECCGARTADVMAQEIDTAYEQARADGLIEFNEQHHYPAKVEDCWIDSNFDK